MRNKKLNKYCLKLDFNNLILFFILIFVLIFILNPQYFYLKLANFNFAIKNNSLAENYVEKFFTYGVVDANISQKYFDSITKDEIDIRAQEKLMKFLEYPVPERLKNSAQELLENIKEDANLKYPENFIAQAPFNQKILRWNDFPITFGFENAQDVSSELKDEIRNAFKAWEDSTGKAVLFKETDSQANIKIMFIEHNPAEADDLKYIVAYTKPEVFNDELKYFEIKFYLEDSQGNKFTRNQIYNTALHEIAHALGLMGHSDDKKDILYLTNNSKIHYLDKKDGLSLGDINTVKLLYRIKPEITNLKNDDADYIPSVILGSKNEIASAKIIEAKNYIQNAPELPNGYIDLAEAYVMEKQYSQALKILKLGLKYATTADIQEIIYYNIAIVAMYMEDFETSFNYLGKSIHLKDNEDKQFFLAQLYEKKQELDSAELIYRKLFNAKPDNIEYAISLANLYLEQNKIFKARKVVKSYMKNNPNDSNNSRLKSYGILRF